MAAALVASRMQVQVYNQPASYAAALSSPASIAVGSLLVMRATVVGDRTLNSITDPRGNTWTIPGGAYVWSNGYYLYMAYCIVATAYQPGDTLTLVRSGSGSAAVTVDEFSGIALISPLDQSALDFDGPNAGEWHNTGIAALTGTEHLLVGGIANYGDINFRSWSPITPPAWTDLPAVDIWEDGQGARTVRGHYALHSGGGTPAYEGYIGGGSNNVGTGILAFKVKPASARSQMQIL